MPATEEQRRSIILGAVSMAGPITEDVENWDRTVRNGIKRLSSMLGENSGESRLISMLDEAKKFPATVLYVGKENTSGRGFIVLKTKPSKHNEEGVETCRTEIIKDNEEARALCRWLREIKGHRVLVYLEMQETKSGQKVRIIQHAEDLGEDRFVTDADYEAGQAKAQESMRG